MTLILMIFEALELDCFYDLKEVRNILVLKCSFIEQLHIHDYVQIIHTNHLVSFRRICTIL